LLNTLKHSGYFLYYYSNVVCSSYACYVCVLHELKNTLLLFPHTALIIDFYTSGILFIAECELDLSIYFSLILEQMLSW